MLPMIYFFICGNMEKEAELDATQIILEIFVYYLYEEFTIHVIY